MALPKFVLAVSLAGLAFMATYASAPAEFSAVELRDVLLLGLAWHTVLLGAALAFLRSKAQNAALALVVSASVASAYMVHTDLYLAGSRAVFWLIVSSIWAGIFSAFGFMDESRWLRGGVPSAALLALALAVVAHLPSFAADVDPAETARDYEEMLNPISFESAPDLYFIAFDGLAPQSLGQEYLGIETTNLIELMNAEFRRLPNLFTEARLSRDALNILGYLDRSIYWKTVGEVGSKGHLTGEHPIPLFDILHDNGYETSLVYVNSYLGQLGPHTDNFEIGRGKTACERLDPSIQRLAFWGYCSLPFAPDSGWGDTYREQFDEIDRILRTSEDRRSQFAFTYFRLPEHTQRSFDYFDPAQRDDYKDQYIHKSNIAAAQLAALVETVENSGRDAIFFVFGDHGPRLTRTVEFSDDPDFYVKDVFGVLGGIWPPDACESWFDEILAEPYLTTLDVVHTILRCLSGGEEALVEPFAEPSARVMRDYRGIPNNDPERSFADYLYE